MLTQNSDLANLVTHSPSFHRRLFITPSTHIFHLATFNHPSHLRHFVSLALHYRLRDWKVKILTPFLLSLSLFHHTRSTLISSESATFLCFPIFSKNSFLRRVLFSSRTKNRNLHKTSSLSFSFYFPVCLSFQLRTLRFVKLWRRRRRKEENQNSRFRCCFHSWYHFVSLSTFNRLSFINCVENVFLPVNLCVASYCDTS